MLKNGIVWKDTQGNPLHAHGGYMIFHEGYYYWYGEDRRDNFYVSCYRSQNLTDWEFRNHILTTNSKMEGYRVRTTLKLINEDGKKVNLERPKVLYNKKTNKFVMWAHFENGKIILMQQLLLQHVIHQMVILLIMVISIHMVICQETAHFIRKRMELRILFLHREIMPIFMCIVYQMII